MMRHDGMDPRQQALRGRSVLRHVAARPILPAEERPLPARWLT